MLHSLLISHSNYRNIEYVVTKDHNAEWTVFTDSMAASCFSQAHRFMFLVYYSLFFWFWHVP